VLGSGAIGDEMVVTQQEIARRLGVSQALVSRALGGRAHAIGAAAATVRRIRDAAARLGYRPSAAALTLRGHSARTLGLVIKDFDDPFFGRLIGAFQGLAHEAHYSLLLTGCDPRSGRAPDVAALLKYHLDGLIVCGSDFEPGGLEPFLVAGRPVVQVGAGAHRPDIVQVSVDEARGLRDLVAFLRRQGHRRLGYLGLSSPPARRRLGLLRAEARRAGLEFRAAWAVTLPAATAAAVAGPLETLLRGGRLPTALVAADDALAYVALRVLHERGVQVPAALSLAGIDDIPAAAMMIPALTTLRQPIQRMAETAFRLALGAGGAHGAKSVKIRPELVIRESCAPPRAAEAA
jgi:LacI family transcriptional regulator